MSELLPCIEGCGKQHFGGEHKVPAAAKYERYHAGGNCKWDGEPLGNRPTSLKNLLRGYHDDCWERKMSFKSAKKEVAV